MLDGKIILVFGGLGLIGRGLVEAIVKAGGTAIAASRSAPTGKLPEAFAALAPSLTKHIEGQAVDVTEPASIDSAFDMVLARHGRLDAVVNMAYPRNQSYGSKFEDVRYDDFVENVTSHLGGAFKICQKAVDVFTRQGHGNIVNVSSIYGIMAPRFQIYDGTTMTKEVEYAVNKSAIVHLTRYLARYLKGRNIRVNCVSPGGVLDGQPESFVRNYNAFCLNKGMLDTEDVTGSFLFLLSDLSRHVNGQNLVIDDGFSL